MCVVGVEIVCVWMCDCLNEMSVEYKGVVDFVMVIDKLCEDLVLSVLWEVFLEDDVVGEEMYVVSGVKELLKMMLVRCWYVDLLDGMMNFVYGYLFSCVSVGLCEGGESTVGVVFNLILDEMFIVV